MKFLFLILALVINVCISGESDAQENDPPVVTVYDAYGTGTNAVIDLKVDDEDPESLIAWFEVIDPNSPSGKAFYFCWSPEWSASPDQATFYGDVPVPFGTEFIVFKTTDNDGQTTVRVIDLIW